MNIDVLLMVLGSLSGVASSILGILALSHPKTDSSLTEVDRVAGWTLLWWLEREKYDQAGQKLCTIGTYTFSFGAICWLLYAIK